MQCGMYAAYTTVSKYVEGCEPCHVCRFCCVCAVYAAKSAAQVSLRVWQVYECVVDLAFPSLSLPPSFPLSVSTFAIRLKDAMVVLNVAQGLELDYLALHFLVLRLHLPLERLLLTLCRVLALEDHCLVLHFGDCCHLLVACH